MFLDYNLYYIYCGYVYCFQKYLFLSKTDTFLKKDVQSTLFHKQEQVQ